MIETEAKIKVTKKQFEHIHKNLGNPEFFIQENNIYTLPNGILRLRKEKNNIILAFKGKNKKSKFNSREEIEVRLENKDIKKVLENISPSFQYSKLRAEISFNNTTLCFDILNDNFFIEIEGKNKDIKKVIKLLNLENNALEKRSYPEMLNEVKNEVCNIS